MGVVEGTSAWNVGRLGRYLGTLPCRQVEHDQFTFQVIPSVLQDHRLLYWVTFLLCLSLAEHTQTSACNLYLLTINADEMAIFADIPHSSTSNLLLPTSSNADKSR